MSKIEIVHELGDFLAASEAGDCTNGAKRAPLLVDTHAHIDTDRFDEDREEMLARAKAAGLAGWASTLHRPSPCAAAAMAVE